MDDRTDALREQQEEQRIALEASYADAERSSKVNDLLCEVAELMGVPQGECALQVIYSRRRVRRVYLNVGPIKPTELGLVGLA